jgi:glycosyltransferase involved in cell wall biosynthesis
VPGRLVGSAWGSDVLVTPDRSRLMRAVTRRVLRHCRLCTSDSQTMAQRMRELGAGEVMVFPFGLEEMPPVPAAKDPGLFFANRGLEALYAPERVIDVFADIGWHWPQARLVVANDGSLRQTLQQRAQALRLGDRVQFVGRLDPATQAGLYARAQWYLSLPLSDSVAVSVLEAMANGCIPILSDLPANRELVRHGENGVLLGPGQRPAIAEMAWLADQGASIAEGNRRWIAQHAMFTPAVEQFMMRLRALA